MNNEQNLEFVAFGRTAEIMTPSGRVFIIREQNGNDDDVLSNPVTGADLTNIDNFLTGIILNEIIDGNRVPVNFNTVVNLPNNDRYFLLIKSRIHSIGNLIKFDFTFDDDVTGSYEEDLENYLHDYTLPFPQKGEPGYFEYKIPPYPENANSETRFYHKTKSGKEVRFGIMTRQGEKILLALSSEQRTKNAEHKARNLEIKVEDNWTKVDNFSIFSKMDMVEINKAVIDIDPIYQFVSEIKHPNNGQIMYYNLIASTSFFYPVEV